MYTEQDLNNLITQVEKEFTSHLAMKEQEFRLAKSEDSEKEPKEEPKKEPEAAESEEPAKEEAPAEAAPEASEQAAEAPAASEAPAQDGSGYDAEDLAHLQEMYSSMSFDELMAHHDAVKVALDAKAAESTPAPSPEAPAEAAPEVPAIAAEAPAEMQKSENMDGLLKSENDALKAKNEELKKNFDAVSKFLVNFVSAKVVPAGKAITNVETIAKSEVATEEKVFSKTEINEILKKKTAEMSLQKSDRELVNAYYLKGASINSIRHLLN